MMESGIFLENEVQKFCSKNGKDEGEVWQLINRIHTKSFNRNLMWEKNKYEGENHVGDIPMAQWFAKTQMVSNAIYILGGLQICIDEGWDLE